MGYRISYRSMERKTAAKRFSFRLPVMVLFCLILFFLLVNGLWPEGAAVLQEAAASSKQVFAVSAWNELAQELYGGEPVAAAFSDFWRKLLT